MKYYSRITYECGCVYEGSDALPECPQHGKDVIEEIEFTPTKHRISWKQLSESEPGIPDTLEEMRGER